MSDVQNTKGPDRLWANPSDADVGEGHCFVTFDFEVTEHKTPYIRAEIANELLAALKVVAGSDNWRCFVDEEWDLVNDAIAKAEGR